ncbi:hypothetical protein QC763_610445 [Podospora pseudopauciseta]|uniref:Uncharacterized protein n=1 Tax=Podospora pseudopauciseta TaxID=2093780 RepID=A0ABR0H6L9_9PEZI|nr:hypothetical protein QC763_610445 [Podospora pseudopauciseta]
MPTINTHSVQIALEGILCGERKNWDHNMAVLPRWIHKLGSVYYTALLENEQVRKYGWLSGRQGERLSPSEMPKPVREILNLASTGLRNLRGITANLKEIIERSEITSNFIERATIEYREGPVGGFERPLGAAGRQMERCVVLSEEMATTYNSFGACLERTMKSSMTDELYLMDAEKREWIKDAALLSKMVTVVYYNVLTAAAELKKVSELLQPGLRLKGEPLVELYTEVLSARTRLKVARELAKLFTTTVDSLGPLIDKLDSIVQDGDKSWRTQMQGDLRRFTEVFEERKDYAEDAAKQRNAKIWRNIRKFVRDSHASVEPF